MDTLTTIFTRRSIRQYTDKGVPGATVHALLKSAMVAPSALDQRPWHFVVVENRDTLTGLAGAMEHCEMLEQATLGLLICGDEGLAKLPQFWVQDCSACAQNVLLAAHALGLGAVWIGLHPIEDRVQAIRQALRVPEPVVPFALIAAGHPAESLPGEERYDPAKVHFEQWQDA